MKRTLISLFIGIGVIIAFFTACGLEITITSVSGKVVDARLDSLAGEGGVSITFTKIDGGTTTTATSESDGTFSLEYSGEGLYQVEATKSGWFFIPQKVYVGNWVTSVPNILGIELDADPFVASTAISFILTWSDSYDDLDGHLTFPDGGGTGFEGSHTPQWTNLFFNPYSALPAGSVGFGPDTPSSRERIYYETLSRASNNDVGEVFGRTIANDGPAIQLDRDDTDGNGPEVITARSLPFWITDWDTSIYGITGNSDNRLPAGTTWTWIGVMEYYVDGWSSTGSGSRGGATDYISSQSPNGTNADAVLHVVQGSTLLGVFKVPERADIRTASLLKINLFIGETSTPGDTWHMQFVPDIQIVDYDGSVGIMSAEDAQPPVFGVTGMIR